MYYTFPTIRGIQARREYYITMCPLKLIPRIFLFNEEDIEPDVRSQRVLNKSRVPEIAEYLVNNSEDYVFSAITASIDGLVDFVPFSDNPQNYNIGYIKVPMSSRIVINDGQHRRAAIDAALKKKPEIGDETISVVFFIDEGLKRSQQMFADLNRYAIRPSGSINILYDHRDPVAEISRVLSTELFLFKGLTEVERSTISNRSTKLFTLSGLYRATNELINSCIDKPYEELKVLSFEYWTEVGKHIKEWNSVKEGIVKASELRRDYINAHAITLVALGKAGCSLIKEFPLSWKEELVRLNSVDWHRGNKYWEGRVTVGGKISFSRNNLVLLTSSLKKVLRIPLTIEEQEAENSLASSNGGIR
ncbi:DNA sulfur modification protein DndB [Paenibacillus sp. LHD-117]|uniref:DNA sulfur modification protein DndB n=1 Tax=Paenibacillus sp. LHD-117 TaxID=3071412 RepID=UPI0027E0EA5F|nr:DNA sulfur modification protein DndB [Paenibacillus sp. LHD-117]MDQ6423050.1 DNA sulfur modification protein DndB [Paenibacillus sp. LHD-117]